jgi:hypothetical protein
MPETLDPPDPLPSRLERLALWALAATLLGSALLLSTALKDQFELPKQLWLRGLSSLVAGLCLAARLRDPDAGWRRGPLDLPVLAWSAWLLVTTFSSIAPWVSWRGEYENFAGSLTQLNYSLLYFAGVQLIRRREDALFLLRAGLAAALGSALYALMQALQRDLVGWSAASVVQDRFFGSLGNPNFLGGLMAMAIPLKLALALDPKRDSQAPDPEQRWRWALLAGWVLAYLLAGKGSLLQLWTHRPGALNSALAVICLWLLALAVAPLLRRQGRPGVAYAVAQGSDLWVLFLALANTGTRGAFLGLMLGLAALSLGWGRLRGHGLQAVLRSLAALGLFGVILAAAFAGLGSSFRSRVYESLRDPGQALERSRLEIWLPALQIWKEHQAVGTGVDSFKTVFPKYSLSRFARYDGENVSSRMAHCEPLQILATQGTSGLLLWLWLCGAFFLAWWRRVGEEGAWWLGLGAWTAAYLGQNLVSFGVAGISTGFWLGLGMTALSTEARWSLPWKPQPRALALSAGLAVALAGLWAMSQTLRADLDYGYASQAQDQLAATENAGLQDLRGVAGYCLQELHGPRCPTDPDAIAELDGVQQALIQSEQRLQQEPASAQSLLPFYRTATGSLLMLVAAGAMESATALCPHEVKYHVYQGLAYEELFRRARPERRELWFRRAVASYQRSTELNPGNAYYRGNLARLFAMGADAGSQSFYDLAAAAYNEALDRAPVTRLFYENLILLQAHYARIEETGVLLDKLEARDKELAPQILIAAASTFFQWRESGLPVWTPQRKALGAQKAMEWGLRAEALHPGDAEQHATLAIFAEAVGHRAEAKHWAEEALQQKPDDARLRKLLVDRGLAH